MARRLAILFLACACGTAPPKPARQNPSPMVDTTRAHQRVEQRDFPGVPFTIDHLFPKPVEVLVTPAAAAATNPRLLIHFMGAQYVPMHAAGESSTPTVLAAIHLGAGSGINEKPFRDNPELFRKLLSAIGSRTKFGRVDLSAFSAGYGAVRAILRTDSDAVDGLLLLDGLHTSYVPEGKPLAEGGSLDIEKLQPFLRFAQRAVAGEKTFLLTHSEVFPGTFASTTETADYLLRDLGIQRKPVLAWGPIGMQQLSEAQSGSFVVLGFAGNTAPDHLDHFHGMADFLARFDKIARP